jgi:hypothetical protein
VVGHNRRAAYLDGSARMYGQTAKDDFECIEGYEDHGLNLLFTWDAARSLTGLVINLACPSQVSESDRVISADYWHETREELRRRYGQALFVLPQCAPAGDQSPHFLLCKNLEAFMRQRRGVSERQDIARRIAAAVDDVFDGAKADSRADLAFGHRVETLNLPVRRVTDEECRAARAELDKLAADQATKPDVKYVLANRHREVLRRYESQARESVLPMELHVLRLGDVALATNPFELFLDFGMRIKARSPALQTFLVQLACSYEGYLPTGRAMRGGSYGAEVASNLVGPEGGQVLVNRTVELIKDLWSGI